MTAGSTSVRYEACRPMRRYSSTPQAATSGPSDIGSRGPMRAARAPERAESTSMMPVTGSRAVPASNGEKPLTTCMLTTSRKNTPPRAA